MNAIIFFLLTFSAFAQEVTSVKFFQEGNVSKVEIGVKADKIKAKKLEVNSDKQIIVDIENVSANEKVLRPFDTSEFSGSVVFISGYQKPGNPKDIRFAIQLRENVRSLMEVQNNKLVLTVENRFGVFDQKKVTQSKGQEAQIAQGKKVERVNVPKFSSVEDILENLTLSGEKKYIGTKISLNVKDIPMVELLKMIADISGFNIILDDSVLKRPNITLTLTNIPWDQALDTVLDLSKLVATKNGNILLVTTLDKAIAEAENQVKANELTEKNEPLVTKIFRISYADLGKMLTMSKEYLTARGKVTSDERTNSLIIKDTPGSIERVRKIFEVLDTQTPQILIESKIVEVTESHAKEIGLNAGANFGYDPVGSVSSGTDTVGGNSTDTQFSGPGFSISTAPSAGSETARNFLGLNITRWNRILDLNLTLQLLEQESKVKIVSSPRVITENKKAATITSSDTSYFPTVVNNEGTITTQFQEISATLSLNVTPQVTNEGSIAMEVSVNKGEPGTAVGGNPPPIQNRSVNTNVLVDNGSTIVIGGLYRMQSSESHSGVPFLKDIPLIGWLFRTAYNPQNEKSEMVIFITPRVVNQEEAGLINREASLLNQSEPTT